ncbi:MAG: tetratricopeptide repeat protein [Verrucomicrobia bacterium]|nr:tetratricopeptide repeat protein [Verrucomicrobiota bacterium]
MLERMQELEPPDSFHVSAVMGWLELGSIAEAKEEFEKIQESYRDCPEVLEAEWRLASAVKDWEAALKVAQRHVLSDPDNPNGWINQSYSLHEMMRTQEAWDRLWSVAERFSKLGVLHYNLACYACQLGHEDVAKKCLNLAIQCQNKGQIKRMALTDPDLQPLWQYVRGI